MESWLEGFAVTNLRRSSETAHDLKTPLNVAVLNLELLRMRMSKLAGGEDEKVNAYVKSIDLELRRMARIFDTFFVLSTPPKDAGEPQNIDICSPCSEAAAGAGITVNGAGGSFTVHGHVARIRQGLSMFFDGASRALREDGRWAAIEITPARFSVAITGIPATEDFELTKLFKFYYTDPLGNADLSLAGARLIAETYGGELIALEERDKVTIRLSFPGG